MGSVTVRRIDDEVIRDLRISAAKRGVSMEQEARDRLRRPLSEEPGEPGEPPVNYGTEEKPWYLESTIDEILAFGRRLPKADFDMKQASDELYDYLEKE